MTASPRFDTPESVDIKRVATVDLIARMRAANPRLPADFDVLPTRGSDKAAGYDVVACITEPVALRVGGRPALIPTGIAYDLLDDGIDVELHPRSGLGIRFGVILANTTGIIDADYQGELQVGLVRTHPGTEGDEVFLIQPGDRIAQLIFKPVLHPAQNPVDRFRARTARGAGGLGSTGVGHTP